ncbi:glycosyltransferase family 4 protein [Caenimonas sedimenti]|uniref:Glycosyltransferase family 4 protein n=1 Tax=Caenimonas sedimenti TaxID=2596921 RepID=A0A562ZUR5_9BURK|nr:glycosyltransferase family 4 protein [Caenimonas sedimenti]TWO72106.1 glycosyltransferase family 4 protein [Caenimonas sedimenti]
MRVCVLAFNSVLSDARILKEADSLAQAGHDVHVHGLADRKHQGTHLRPSGARVTLLVPPKQPPSKSRKLIVPVAGGLALGTAWYVDLFAHFPLLPYVLLAASGAVIALGFPKLKVHLVFPFLKGIIAGVLARSPKWFPVGWMQDIMVRSTHSARIRLLENAANASGADIVHCHDMYTLPAGAAAAAAMGAQLVWDAHEIYEEIAQATPQQQLYYGRLLKRLHGRVDAFITINDSIAGFYAGRYPALPPSVIVKNATLPLGSVEDDGRMRRAAQLPETQKIVLYQGGFAEKRGLRDLVAAAEFLDPDWTLVMMGWGNLEPQLREIAQGVLGRTVGRQQPAICFLPPAPHAELALWTAGARVGLIPYERAGLNHLFCTPNKLWEYPAAGVPILCSPLTEMSLVIARHGVGWLLPEPATPRLIARTINALTEAELSAARAACATYIAQDNWQVYEARLVRLYQDLAARRAVPAGTEVPVPATPLSAIPKP